MTRTISTSLFTLSCVAFLGWSNVAAAEELWVIKDGVLDKKALAPGATDNGYCSGKTVDGFHVTGPNTLSRLRTAKSAQGDCEFKVVFSASSGRPKWRFPAIQISDRGSFCFWKTGSPIILSTGKVSLPLKAFDTAISPNPFDGKLHSMAVKRVGDKISFYYEDKKLNEQPIDRDVRLHLWFDALFLHAKIKSIKLTADKLSDDLSTDFKRAAPIEDIYVGSGVREKPEYGKACRYRIPALAVSTKGTILAFAEARRLGGADVGDIDAVVRRSEDGGKTWGPEIVVWDDGGNSINNPCPVVDPKNGRIWICMGRYNPYPTANQHVSYSDDDGKTWSKPRDITQAIQATIEPKKKCWIPGPGAGLVMRHEKYAGRLVVPMGFAPLVVYSDDNGETWKGGGWGGSDGGEAKCAELLDGSLLFNGRTGTKKRALSIVTEGGTKNATKTWYADDLPDPSCQGAIIRHSWPKDGKPGLLLYSGPASITSRAQGTLFGSYDDGKTWPWKLEYYQGPSGYSDVTVLRDGRVAVLFEKDGKSNLGFTILPAPPAQPPGAGAEKPAGKTATATDKTPPLVLDKETGHYKDLSYEALNDEGLSWEEKTRLFGGDTATYAALTDEQRKAKQQEVEELLAKIDTELVNKCEAEVRAWLDAQAAAPLKKTGWETDWRKNWSVYTKVSRWPLVFGSIAFFRAYEIWGDEKYLKAGLERADVFVRD